MRSVLKNRWTGLRGSGVPRQRPNTQAGSAYRTVDSRGGGADVSSARGNPRQSRRSAVSPKAATEIHVKPQTAQQAKRNSGPTARLLSNDLVCSPEEFNFEDFVTTDIPRPPSRQGAGTGTLIEDLQSVHSPVQRLPIKALPLDRPPSRKKLPPGSTSYKRRNMSCDEFYEVLSEDNSIEELPSQRTSRVLDVETPLYQPASTREGVPRRHRSKAPVLLNRREKIVRRIKSREAKLQEAYTVRESSWVQTAQQGNRPQRKARLNSSLEPGFLKLFASKH